MLNPLWRDELHARDELPAGNPRRPGALLLQGHRGFPGLRNDHADVLRQDAGLKGADLVADLPNVRRGGAAAAADDPNPGLDHALGVLRHVGRGGRVDVAAVDVQRDPRVGLDAHGPPRDAHHFFRGLEHHAGTFRAVQPDCIRRKLIDARREQLGISSVEGRPFAVDGQGGDEGEVACATRAAHGGGQLPQVDECLQDEQVRPGGGKGAGLSGEEVFRFRGAHPAQGLDAHSQGTDGPGDIHRVFPPGLFDCLPGQLHRALVDGGKLLFQPGRAQLGKACAPAVCRQDVCACIQVLTMDPEDELGVGQAHLLEGAVEEHALLVEHGPHGPVEENGGFPRESSAKVFFHVRVVLSLPPSRRQRSGAPAAFLPRRQAPRGTAPPLSTPGSSGRSPG